MLETPQRTNDAIQARALLEQQNITGHLQGNQRTFLRRFATAMHCTTPPHSMEDIHRDLLAQEGQTFPVTCPHQDPENYNQEVSVKLALQERKRQHRRRRILRRSKDS